MGGNIHDIYAHAWENSKVYMEKLSAGDFKKYYDKDNDEAFEPIDIASLRLKPETKGGNGSMTGMPSTSSDSVNDSEVDGDDHENRGIEPEEPEGYLSEMDVKLWHLTKKTKQLDATVTVRLN